MIIAFAGIFIAYYLYMTTSRAAGEVRGSSSPAFSGPSTTNTTWTSCTRRLSCAGFSGSAASCKRVVDETLIDGAMNGVAWLLRAIGGLIRLFQSGYVQGYAFALLIGAIVVLGYLIIRVIL